MIDLHQAYNNGHAILHHSSATKQRLVSYVATNKKQQHHHTKVQTPTTTNKQQGYRSSLSSDDRHDHLASMHNHHHYASPRTPRGAYHVTTPNTGRTTTPNITTTGSATSKITPYTNFSVPTTNNSSTYYSNTTTATSCSSNGLLSTPINNNKSKKSFAMSRLFPLSEKERKSSHITSPSILLHQQQHLTPKTTTRGNNSMTTSVQQHISPNLSTSKRIYSKEDLITNNNVYNNNFDLFNNNVNEEEGGEEEDGSHVSREFEEMKKKISKLFSRVKTPTKVIGDIPTIKLLVKELLTRVCVLQKLKSNLEEMTIEIQREWEENISHSDFVWQQEDLLFDSPIFFGNNKYDVNTQSEIYDSFNDLCRKENDLVNAFEDIIDFICTTSKKICRKLSQDYYQSILNKIVKSDSFQLQLEETITKIENQQEQCDEESSVPSCGDVETNSFMTSLNITQRMNLIKYCEGLIKEMLESPLLIHFDQKEELYTLISEKIESYEALMNELKCGANKSNEF
ncbi:hypothetical protein ABK040_010431 [Willaertia magna]